MSDMTCVHSGHWFMMIGNRGKVAGWDLRVRTAVQERHPYIAFLACLVISNSQLGCTLQVVNLTIQVPDGATLSALSSGEGDSSSSPTSIEILNVDVALSAPEDAVFVNISPLMTQTAPTISVQGMIERLL